MKRTTRLALRGAAAGAIGLAALTAGTGAALIAGTGTAQAGPYTAPTTEWCPGQALPFQEIRWDMSRCHVWFGVPFGQGNVSMVYPDGTAADSFISADVPPPELTPSRPQPLPPGTPFCSPRGSLFIIGPICDEIGVDMPPGSVRR
ncbi:hypothetical protein [Mycolicibacterium grossiae]|uniref:Secreted protein n=1 Tax=Mycolicibacterium grossiae TaxID=1552759 RepID=A0A1E8Q5E6_9MYCO|nr:hypothetical protein [Mycolicibacterium grossiae]OFJ53793.1 hypothetical protein BEL07_10430 [Mycolicibacterium grossiae]QEM43944.1 hypothetical protein FZ046_03300 [Mycolicibacterium grossiae]